jgi:hypothetical protein
MRTPMLRPRQLVIYCDESDDKGKHFSHFYGGAVVDESKRQRIEASLQAVKDSANFQGEAKWTKIGSGHEARYITLIDALFDHLKAREIKVRIMFLQNTYTERDLEDYHIENQYFLLYYQFVKHAFGLQFSNPTKDRKLVVQLRFDELPENADRCKTFKEYLAGMSNFPPFAENRVVFPISEIAQIVSKQHVIAQCLDVVLGSMQFRLNDKHLEKPKDSNRRGKRTIAKERVYKHINKRIRELYPNFNIGISTGQPDVDSRWSHEYRHWRFVPTGAEVDNSKSKSKK